MADDKYIVDKEISRRQLYITMIQDLTSLLSHTKLEPMYIKQMALRYFYNKIAQTTYEGSSVPSSDPLFILGDSTLAKRQIKSDLKYSGVNDVDPNSIIDLLESYVNTANEKLPKLKYKHLTPVRIDNKLVVNNFQVNDFRRLSDINIYHAFALGLRYQYIALNNHNLARMYKSEGYKTSMCLEGFGTAYNHYFDLFCSPFPDLEAVFGSIGSFFSVKEWPKKCVHVNPPFDAELMSLCIYKVLESIKTLKKGYTFTFVLPDWLDLQSFRDLRDSKYTVWYKIHDKGDFPFIDYHKNPDRCIYPCKIFEAVLKS